MYSKKVKLKWAKKTLQVLAAPGDLSGKTDRESKANSLNAGVGRVLHRTKSNPSCYHWGDRLSQMPGLFSQIRRKHNNYQYNKEIKVIFVFQIHV